ncbi:1,4-alpha-glucan branching protein GlgB [bacterium]|nr:1,4-alpha-glucan branching protein GlgB [bacterium]
MITTIYPNDIISIVNSTHKSPHFILGMHMVDISVEKEIKTIPSVRAFIPDGRRVFVVDIDNPDSEWEMGKVHDDGVFEALIWDRSEKFKYSYRIEGYSGAEWTMEDPYEDWVDEVTSFDRYLFSNSRHYKIYEKMGAHVKTINGKKGVFFSVWAPTATRISVIGDFNNWDGRRDPMELLRDSGVWVLFKPGAKEGAKYRYEIRTRDGNIITKSDPYAFYSEFRPATASIVYTLEDYEWNDSEWLDNRYKQETLDKAVSIYEVHLGSWRRKDGEEPGYLSYRELAEQLVPYVKEMGFTHIQLMPIEEHPFDGSWGYQITGYFSPTSRHGEPKDLQFFIDTCHQAGIAVLLDWVPGHFPKDPHGLIEFDGTALYEHQDPKQGEHPDWGTKIFNYGRPEVKNFLLSNALYWIDKFHFDGLRVDAVASMLYLDYSKKPGQWIANKFGGRENLEAIDFFKHLNSVVHKYFPGVMMIAEESTAWPGVSKPVYSGGLGFGYKWNMGWMNDIIEYMKKDAIYRRYHHSKLTFGLVYAWSENFILPFSHDEVVHGKGSMINKMPGDYWQKFASLRALYTLMWGHPGKQLLFMGQEFGQIREWSEDRGLDWHLLGFDFHSGLQECVKSLNWVYQNEVAMWENDFDAEGFDGINCDDSDNSIFSFIRYGQDRKDFLVFVVNFTPIARYDYILGVPEQCYYQEIFNSDSQKYGGSNVGNFGGVMAKDEGALGKEFSIGITVPPLSGIILKPRS